MRFFRHAEAADHPVAGRRSARTDHGFGCHVRIFHCPEITGFFRKIVHPPDEVAECEAPNRTKPGPPQGERPLHAQHVDGTLGPDEVDTPVSDRDLLHVPAHRMDSVRNTGLAGTFGDPSDKGSMNLNGRDPGVPERLRQHECRASVPHTQVEHPTDGIAARNTIQRAQR